MIVFVSFFFFNFENSTTHKRGEIELKKTDRLSGGGDWTGMAAVALSSLLIFVFRFWGAFLGNLTLMKWSLNNDALIQQQKKDI